MAQWKQYSGMWTRQQQMQAASAQTWPNVLIGSGLWGWGSSGIYLGLNDAVYRSSPVQVGALTTWLTMAAGDYSTLALQSNKTLWAFGDNTYGQIGDGTTIIRSSPVQVGSLTTWSFVASGNQCSFAIKTDGTLWSWGYNDFGQLGSGTNVRRSSPVQVGGLTDWASINSSQYGHTLSVKTDGTLWAWGRNLNGQLGTINLIARSSPVQVGGNNWLYATAASQSSFAIRTDGTLWSWGENNQGQLGQRNIIYRSSPTQIGSLTTWSSISDGFCGEFMLATRSDGTLWSWGYNGYGSLGDGTVITRSSPVQIGSGTNWSSCSSGKYYSLALQTNGTLWSWGINNGGQLGQNNKIYRSSPVQVGSLTTWSKVSAGYSPAFALQNVYTT